MMEGPPDIDGLGRNSPALGEPRQAYRAVAQAVVASAVTDLVKGRPRAEEAYQFLCGAGDENRAVLEFWCSLAGSTPDQVMSTARARPVSAWRIWWRDHGKHRLKLIQHDLEKMRPRVKFVNAGSGQLVTEEDRDARWPVQSPGVLSGKP